MSRKCARLFLFYTLSAFILFVRPSFATQFDLIPPSGTLQRGQDITFTINLNTEGASLTSVQSGLTYDSTLLQYVSVTAGATMNSVVGDTATYGTGKVLFTGTNTAGFNGTGVFATVVFTIIAQSSGSTEICTLWLPEPTPTIGPTTPPVYSTPIPLCGAVCTSNSQCPSDMPCYIVSGQTSGYCRRPACPQISNCVCPGPTALPQTGSTESADFSTVAAIGLLIGAGVIALYSQKQKYSVPHTHKKKHNSQV